MLAAEPGRPTVRSYFTAFAPAPTWEELPEWPPDVFALANLILDHTEAYRFAVSPMAGRRWPPVPRWNQDVRTTAAQWRDYVEGVSTQLPPGLVAPWTYVRAQSDTPLSAVRAGHAPELVDALLTLHALADETCSDLATEGRDSALTSTAWKRLDETQSISRIDPARVRVTPKTQLGSRGITIRSFSRYLSLNYVAIDTRWHRIRPTAWSSPARTEFGILLVPWPLKVQATAFHPVEGPLDNMDPDHFGFFEFDPEEPLDLDLIHSLLRHARRRRRQVHAVVLPEAAATESEAEALRQMLTDQDVLMLVTGVRQPSTPNQLGGNHVLMAIRAEDGWVTLRQQKHHRWCLDRGQIAQYHLSRVLDPRKTWWEAIHLPVRTTEIIDIGGGATVVPLICEDLARLDEVSELMRQVGPTLVIALLLDGPQLPQRWSCRYAGVLSDEPGSVVLTLTAAGMAARSRPPGTKPSRAVALWSEPDTGSRHLDLAAGAAGVLLTAALVARPVWTADGRPHQGITPALHLTEAEPLKA